MIITRKPAFNIDGVTKGSYILGIYSGRSVLDDARYDGGFNIQSGRHSFL